MSSIAASADVRSMTWRMSRLIDQLSSTWAERGPMNSSASSIRRKPSAIFPYSSPT
jgi:hypothetical protein